MDGITNCHNLTGEKSDKNINNCSDFSFDCILQNSIPFFIGIACSSSNRSTLKDFIGSTLFFHDFSFTETCDLLYDFNSLLPYTGTLPQNFCKIFVQLNPCFQKQNVFVVNLIRTFAKHVSFLTTAFPGIGALNYHVFFGNSTFSTRPFKYY